MHRILKNAHSLFNTLLIYKNSMTEIENKYKINVKKFGYINWLGAYSLWLKETKRFLTVWVQTIVSPIITTLLFWSVLNISISEYRGEILGIPFITFLWPGLISMSILQASFSHTSSSIMIGKMMHTIEDIVSAPLNAAEVTLAIILAACTRSFFILVASIIIFAFIIDLSIHSYFLLFIFTFLGSFILGSFGFLAGLYANKFDEMSGIQSFIIVPCTMLSGVFYTVDKLPYFFQSLSQFNPFWFVIDGMRYSFLGIADGSIAKALIYLSVLAFFSWLFAFILYSRGYKIKA